MKVTVQVSGNGANGGDIAPEINACIKEAVLLGLTVVAVEPILTHHNDDLVLLGIYTKEE